MAAHNDPKAMRDDELIIERTFDAPAALVFRIWEDRDHMVRWLGPADFTCTHLESDFRPGGKWRACIASKQYGDHWMGGEYKEIEKDRRIVYSFAWDSDEDGANNEDGRETLITVTLAEKDGKTVQTFHQTPFVSVEMRDSHIEGWNESFDKEQAYAEELAKSEAA